MTRSIQDGDCNGKVIFRSYYSASRYADKRRKMHRHEKNNEPYRCRLCNAWHLSTTWKNLDKRQDTKKPPD